MEKENFKEIHIGKLISDKVKEYNIEILRICNFLGSTYEEIYKMYDSESLDTKILLRWSKLLKYDFFRIYTQHLILFSPPLKNLNCTKKKIQNLFSLERISIQRK